MRLRLLIFVLAYLILLQPARAESPLDPLLASGALTIDTRLDEPGTLVPGQRAKMIVEIATNTWFTGGTRIRLPEVAGLVILQTDQFAANASESRGGQSWVIQRWTIDIYPQQAGFVQEVVRIGQINSVDPSGRRPSRTDHQSGQIKAYCTLSGHSLTT